MGKVDKRTIVKSESFGKYTVNTFSDGTYGYMMPGGTDKNMPKYIAVNAWKRTA